MDEFYKFPSSVSNSEKSNQHGVKKIRLKPLIGLFLAVVIIAGAFLLKQSIFPQTNNINYIPETYRLIPEKISQSASIKILLPAAIDATLAINNITFNPEIKGTWQSVPQKQVSFINIANAAEGKYTEIVFQPTQALELNRYYEVQLVVSSDNIIKEDFLVVENPKVLAVFPSDGVETPESSEITIVFNRPIVPLTTLSELEAKDIPVEITPITKGKFKWITTSNLQFIPENGLIASSNYVITIKSGFVSIDGLPIEGGQYFFTTRNLRLVNNLNTDYLSYKQPFSLVFNQPVDLEKTVNSIALVNKNNQNVAFTAKYFKNGDNDVVEESESVGSSNVLQKLIASVEQSLGLKSNKSQKGELNKSIIQIIPKNDKFGRSGFWDFEEFYTLRLANAYPLEGNINLVYPANLSFSIDGLVQSVTATSDRTNDVTPSFFDPQGKLWITFYEEINLNKSTIQALGLQNISYGQKCSDPKINLSDELCQKVDNKKVISLTFDSNLIGIGQNFAVSLEKLVNTDGLVMNQTAILEPVQVYPQFVIKAALSKKTSEGDNLKELSVCTNNPIKVPDKKEDLKNIIKSDSDLQIIRMDPSYYIYYESSYYLCSVGQYQTDISYRLNPNKEYQITLALNDVFGQYQEKLISLKTGNLEYEDRTFYRIQGYSNITSPKNTQLVFAAENLKYVDLTICKTSALSQLQGSNICQETETTTLSLPNNYWVKNYFKVDVADYFENPIGYYILKFSNPDLKRKVWSYTSYSYGYEAYAPESFLSVTNLAVTRKQANFYSSSLDPSWVRPDSLFWVNDINTLQPITGAKVSLYINKLGVYQLDSTTYTDSQGIASATKEADAIIVSNGKDSTFLNFGDDNFNWASSAHVDSQTYIYTDKPIYRPGETVYIKGICRVGYDGNYERCNDYSDIFNSLTITDSKYKEAANQTVTFNEFGTFSNEFIIDKTSPLGNYRVCLDGSDCGSFDVEEYKAAAFEVNVNSDKADYVSKDIGKFDVEANYYFGLPVEKSKVTYSLSTQNYYFDKYQDEYFSFGSYWYYDYSYSYGEKFLLRGETELSDNGKGNIELDLNLAKYFKDKDVKSKIFILDVTVQTSQGQSVSAQKSFIVHAGDFYLGTYSNDFGLAKNQKTTFKVKSVSKEGKPISVSGLTLNTYSVDYIYAKRQDADGGYSYDWSVERKLLETSTISTDTLGNFSKEIKFNKEGEYEIEIVGKDKNNNQITANHYFYVYGDSLVSIQPYEGTTIEIKADKIDLSIGDTASVIIKSPYPNAKALISLERGKIFSYEIKEIKGNIFKYTFPIKEEYFPNIYLSVVLQSSDPEIRYGNVEFTVGTKIKDLNVTVKTDKTNYLPGEKVKLDITATDFNNQPLETDVSLAVIDLSVLALKGNPKKNPVQFFYGGFPLTISTGSNIKNVLEDADKYLPNAPEASTKGGGGYDADSLAKKVRGIFKDTAYWQSVVKTNSSGKAFVEFILPDNLTTWQVEALGVSKDTQLGVGYSEFTSKKPLMVTILKPRFIIPGDTFEIGAKIFNQSLTTQTINVAFNSSTLTTKGKTEEGLSLESGKTKTIYFKVEAPLNMEEGIHKFNVLAKANDIEDQINETIKINKPLTFETTATAGYTNQSKLREYIYLPVGTIQDKGDVTVKASATLGVFISDGLKYLIDYPYGCSEQISSRLYAIAIVKKGLNLPNVNKLFDLDKIKYENEEYTVDQLVQIGLSKLYNNQGYDGGFGYWGSSSASPYLTAHVLEALKALKLANFNVSESVIGSAESYLENYLLNFKLTYDYDKDTFITLSYALIDDGTANQTIKNKLNSFAQDRTFINDKIGTESLAKLTIIMGRISGFKTSKGLFNLGSINSANLIDSLANRIKIDSRGAFLEPMNNTSWFSYESTIKDTSLYLKAVALYKQDQPIIDKVLRWLLNSRDNQGVWRSTNNTLAVVDGMVEYIKFKKETESNFELNIALDDSNIKSITFGSQNIFEQLSEKVSLDRLTLGKANILEFSKNNLNNVSNNFYYDIALKYYLPAGQIPPRDEGISVSRKIFKVSDETGEIPIEKAKVGDILRVNLVITVPKDRRFVTIEDFIPAGAEIINMELATEQKSLRLQETELTGREIIPDFKELRDDRAFIFKEYMRPGVYEFDYYIRAFSPGEYAHLPAMAYEMYTPENFGRSAGEIFTIEQP